MRPIVSEGILTDIYMPHCTIYKSLRKLRRDCNVYFVLQVLKFSLGCKLIEIIVLSTKFTVIYSLLKFPGLFKHTINKIIYSGPLSGYWVYFIMW